MLGGKAPRNEAPPIATVVPPVLAVGVPKVNGAALAIWPLLQSMVTLVVVALLVLVMLAVRFASSEATLHGYAFDWLMLHVMVAPLHPLALCWRRNVLVSR